MRVILGCLVGLMASGAWADEFSVRSKVSDVLVTSQGGIITRAIPVDLPAGKHDITIFGASYGEGTGENFDFPKASGLGMIAVGTEPAIAHDPNYMQTAQYQKLRRDVDSARAQLHAHQKRQSAQQAVVQAAEVRLTFVKQFASGGSSVLSLEQLTDPNLISNLTSQLGTQTAKAVIEREEAERLLRGLRDRGVELKEALARASVRLQAIVPERRDEQVLKLTVLAAQPFKGEISLHQLSGDVAWVMLSDVRLSQDGNKGDLQIAQKALVRQVTGEDWDGVKVTLSTADLSRDAGMDLPQSLIKRLFDPEKRYAKGKAQRPTTIQFDSMVSSSIEEAQMELTVGPELGMGNTMSVAGQTQVFEISAPLNIQSGEGNVFVPLQEIDISVDLYARASSRGEAAFLYADITNETGGRILPSLASLHRDGQYFGEFRMGEIVAGDEYPLQLGVLDGLLVDHVVIKREDGDRGLLSSSQIAESRFETTVTSLLDYDLPVRLYDRLPVSESEDLIIKEYAKPAISERDIDGRRGVLSWNWDMVAGGEQVVEFGYDLSWPSGFVVE